MLSKSIRAAHVALALCCSMALVLLYSSAVLAQPQTPREPIDGERFKPAVTHDGFVTTEGSGIRPPADRWEFAVFLNYALNSLVVVNSEDEVSDRFISGRMGGDLIASATIIEMLAVGLDVPFYLIQTGDEDPSFAGLGDIRIVPKVRLIDDREMFGLSVIGELRVPSHVGDFSGGARMIQFVPKIVADHRFGRTGFRIGGNVGVAIREGTVFQNVDALSEYVYSAAASYRIGGWDGLAAIGVELDGGVGLTKVHFEEIPLEARLFSMINPSKEWEIVFGPGMGIVPGYGIPTFRFFAGVRYAPTNNDRDGDGIPDDEDACPDVPEDRDGVEDVDGCPEFDDERDDDSDGIVNIDDKCPGEKETINGIEDEDGCPDKGPERVIRKEDRLVIMENIEFATGSAVIRPSSYSILDQISLMVKANPDIKKLRIEGHTDSRGSRDMNVKLSQDRANSVRNHLIGQGVSADRLEAKGFGPDRPIVEENNPAAMQKNRRVEFIIEKQ